MHWCRSPAGVMPILSSAFYFALYLLRKLHLRLPVLCCRHPQLCTELCLVWLLWTKVQHLCGPTARHLLPGHACAHSQPSHDTTGCLLCQRRCNHKYMLVYVHSIPMLSGGQKQACTDGGLTSVFALRLVTACRLAAALRPLLPKLLSRLRITSVKSAPCLTENLMRMPSPCHLMKGCSTLPGTYCQ